jgi:NADPH:quinone reductase-like Zn-dependent oxidoreductase
LFWFVNIFQVIDYQSKQSLPDYLTTTHGNSRFDAIIDCRGVQELYSKSAGYLTLKGTFASVGPRIAKYTMGSMLFSLVHMAKNFLLSVLPQFLGGTGRLYKQSAAFVNQEGLATLAKMAADGDLKIHIGESYYLEEAQKVRPYLLQHYRLKNNF